MSKVLVPDHVWVATNIPNSVLDKASSVSASNPDPAPSSEFAQSMFVIALSTISKFVWKNTGLIPVIDETQIWLNEPLFTP